MPAGKSDVNQISVVDLYERARVLPLLRGGANLMLYAAAALIAANRAWQPVSFLVWPFMGCVLAGFLAAAHDCVHSTFVTAKASNRFAGAAWCTPVFFNFTLFKSRHLTHHRYTRVEGDTESAERMRSLADYLGRILIQNPLRSIVAPVRMLLGDQPPELTTSAKQEAARHDAVAGAAWLAVVSVLTVLHPRLLVATYWGPYLFFMPAVGVTALPEHYGREMGPEILRSTRSVTTNALVRAIFWNGNYHVEHHLFPAVPSFNLPEVSRRLQGVPVSRSKSYFGFHLDVFRNLSLCRRNEGSHDNHASV